ncbi:MAG: hypothetical protein QG614_315 [Patescibacteria group bacterium]|nr:hypothetical protein [Patescibacteria group bacterium]
MSKGKIIAIVGGPRSGKSFLVGLLAKHYEGVAILEGEERDFPERIREDIQKNIRPLERIAWFRNKLVKEFFRAIELKQQGKIVVIDNFWISYQLYIDALAKDFEGEVINDIAFIDRKTLEWPDLTVLLTLSEDGIRDFVKLGGREFDNNENFIKNQALPIHKLHNDFFTKEDIQEKVIVVQRDNLDFYNEGDFKNLIQKIDDRI